MPMYRTNELIIDIPEDWSDQTIVAFRIPAPRGGREGSFVITRDQSRGMRPFAAYLSDQQEQCRKSLPEFALIKSDPINIRGRDAAWLEFTWKNDGQIMLLRQVYCDCAPMAIICTLTVRPDDLAHCEPAWRHAMASLDFDRLTKADHPALSPRKP